VRGTRLKLSGRVSRLTSGKVILDMIGIHLHQYISKVKFIKCNLLSFALEMNSIVNDSKIL